MARSSQEVGIIVITSCCLLLSFSPPFQVEGLSGKELWRNKACQKH